MSKTTQVSIPIPASQVTAPAQSVPVPAGQQVLSVVVPDGFTATLSGSTLTVAQDVVVQPPPPPPPTVTPSADGATLAAGVIGQIVDAALGVWTFAIGPAADSRGSVINLNGQPTTSAAKLLLYFGKQMYCQTSSGTWWGGANFGTRQSGDPRNPSLPSGGGTVPPPPPTGVRVVFPGAMGGGALTVGGRGGKVIEVTNLNDSGAGSFREAMTTPGARTVVFNRLQRAGVIPIMSQIFVGDPFVTVAGQTAPGQIILAGSKSTDSLRFSTHDILLQYLTCSPDNPNIGSGPSVGTVGCYFVNSQIYNVMTDHLSCRWAGNKIWLMYAGFAGEFNKDTTMQDCLMYESHAGHPVGPSISLGDDPTRTAASGNIDFLRNFFVNLDHRITEYNHSPMTWANNVTHNRGSYGILALGRTQTDVINNVWSNANLRPSQYPKPIYSTDGTYAGSNPGTPSFFVDGNIGDTDTDITADQWSLCGKAQGENVVSDLGPMPSAWKRTSSMARSNGVPLNLLPAKGLAQALAPTIGNSQHLDLNGNWVSHRDAADKRIVNQVLTKGNGAYWPNVTNIGASSYPPPPKTDDWNDVPILDPNGPYPSSQHDGLSDAFKQTLGLDTSKPQNNVVMPDGLTALEWFLAGRKS